MSASGRVLVWFTDPVAGEDPFCSRQLDDGAPCPGRRLPGTETCLVHAGPSAERDAFLSDVAWYAATGHLAGLTYDAALFAEVTDGLRAAGRVAVDFTGSTFDCAADFTGMRFGDAGFHGVWFVYSANFRSAVFEGRADFTDVRFGTHGQSFAAARFEDDVSFECSASAPAEVRRTTALHLSGATLAKGARFDGRHFVHERPGDRFDVNLADAVVSGNLVFLDVVCDGTIVLDRLVPTQPVTVLAPGGSRVSLAELTLTKPLTVTTRVYGQSGTADAQPARLVSLVDATLESPLTVGDGVALTECEMAGATGLDRLRITGVDPRWPVYRHRRVLAEELRLRERGAAADTAPGAAGTRPAPDPRQLESVYRQLRAALEATRAAPAAADFYYGEMEMRRLSCRRGQLDSWLLLVYKLVSGYGLRAYRALATYLVLLLATTALLRYRTGWFVADQAAAAGSAGLAFDRFWDVFAITARASVTVLSAVTTGLTAAGTVLFVVLRLAGPAMVALTILALRARVQR